MRITYGGATRTGRRNTNQDGLLLLPEVGLFAVADGLGGLDEGDVASAWALTLLRIAAGTLGPLRERVATRGDPESRLALLEALAEVFLTAAARIHESARVRRIRMGTTLTAGVFAGESLYLAHVGDTRLYLSRAGVAAPVTEDHTVAAARARAGAPADADDPAPSRHTLTRAIGVMPDVLPDFAELHIARGDALLFCSDGVWDVLSDEHVALLLAGAQPPQEAAERIVEEAYDRGSSDNLTAVVVRIEEARADRLDLPAFMTLTPLLAGLDPGERRRLAPYLQVRTCPAGQVVVREGDPGETLWIIAEGELDVTAGGRFLTRLGPGGHFGEIALIRRSARTATVTAATPARVVGLDRVQFEALLARRPELAAQIQGALLRVLAERVVELTGRLTAR